MGSEQRKRFTPRALGFAGDASGRPRLENRWARTSSVDPVILSEAKNLSPGMHTGRSVSPSLIRHGFCVMEEIHPKGTLVAFAPSAFLAALVQDDVWESGIGMPHRAKGPVTFVPCRPFSCFQKSHVCKGEYARRHLQTSIPTEIRAGAHTRCVICGKMSSFQAANVSARIFSRAVRISQR